MPGPNFVLDKGFQTESAVDMFKPVTVGSANETVTAVTAATDAVVGFAQETASAQDALDGRIVNIRMLGITRAIAGEALGAFVPVTIDADGKVVAAAAGSSVVGSTTFAVVAEDDHVDVLLTPNGAVPV